MKLALPLRQFRPHRCVAQAAVPACTDGTGSEVAEHVTLRCSLEAALRLFEVEAEDTQAATGSCLMTFST